MSRVLLVQQSARASQQFVQSLADRAPRKPELSGQFFLSQLVDVVQQRQATRLGIEPAEHPPCGERGLTVVVAERRLDRAAVRRGFDRLRAHWITAPSAQDVETEMIG